MPFSKEIQNNEMLEYIESKRYLVGVFWHNHYMVPLRKKLDEGEKLSKKEQEELRIMYISLKYVKESKKE